MGLMLICNYIRTRGAIIYIQCLFDYFFNLCVDYPVYSHVVTYADLYVFVLLTSHLICLMLSVFFMFVCTNIACNR